MTPASTLDSRLRHYSILSLTLHGLAFALFSKWGSGLFSPPTPRNPVEITLDASSKQMVHTSQVLDEENAKSPRFAGEKRNRVANEERSELTGRFQEGVLMRPSPLEVPDAGAKPAPSMKNLLQLGQSPDKLPEDIRKGANTVLSTEPVLYASFWNRLKDDVYEPWVERVQRAIALRATTGRSWEPNTYRTLLEIEMDRSGNLVAIRVDKGSGIDALDEAPVEAFWDREPFRNPPTQLFPRNEEIARFTFEFQFELKRGFQILPWRI